MLKYIILCLSINLCCVLCDLDKEKGAECEWDGVKGQCVEDTRCMTTLDTKSPEPPVCSRKGEDRIICCTDCDLVNDTRNVVLSPTTDIFWKDGTKARDNCLTYIQYLPYKCRSGGFYSGIKRQLNEQKNCHMFSRWGVGGASPHGQEPGAQYPHQVLLGYGETLETANWLSGGSLISDRFILTAAHIMRVHLDDFPLTYVALDVRNRSDSPSNWQTHKIKRFIPAPEYKAPRKYHDIALIETETPIIFNRNVLPACLHVTEAEDDQAVTTTWRDLESQEHSNKFVDTIQTIKVEKFSDEECKAAYGVHRLLRNGFDVKTQMCYGSKTNASESCHGLSGEPLLIDTQFSCAYAVIGVTSFGAFCGPQSVKPDVYTRVAAYVPWIESIVWPDN